MARTVRDAAILLDSIVGFDEADSYTSANALAQPPLGGSYGAHLGERPLSSTRCGVLRTLFGDEQDSSQAAVNEVISSALRMMEASSANLIDVDIPNLTDYLENTSFFFCRSKSDLDSFLVPKMGTTLSDIYTAKNYPHGSFGIEAIARNDDTASYASRLETRDEFQRIVTSLMLRENISAILFPTTRLPSPRLSEINWNMQATFPANTHLASQLHLPAISVPVGFTAAGLPVGLELVGLPFSEQKLLELAYEIELIVKARTAPTLSVRGPKLKAGDAKQNP